MANWGNAQWMTNPPSYPYPDLSPGTSFFSNELSYPQNGARNVPRTTVLRAVAYDPYDVSTTPEILFDGVDIIANPDPRFTGAGGLWAGVKIIALYTRVPFEPRSAHTVEFRWKTPYDIAYRAAFTVEDAGSPYDGNGATALEQLLVTPCTRFLELEPVRQLLLQIALRDTANPPLNRDYIAARALYQVAYDTELASLLNPYALQDNSALLTSVPQKRRTLDMLTAMQPFQNRIELGIESLFARQALPSEYRRAFRDALDSMLFTYPVAAAIVAVMLARAIESANGASL